MSRKILLVEDEQTHLRMLAEAIEGEGYQVDCAENGQQGLDLLAAHEYAVAVFDIRLPDIDGFDLLKFALQHQPDCPILMMTGQASVLAAVEAMRLGAFDYLAKPFRMDLLLLKLKRLLQFRDLSDAKQASVEHGGMVGKSPVLHRLLRDLHRAGPTSASVLLQGETGCGKELAARLLHNLSARSKNPFVAVNCAAIPTSLLEAELFGFEKGAFTDAMRQHKGLIEQSAGGTLFLDEIGEISEEMQVKLLRVLEERELTRLGGSKLIPVDFRLLTATHRNLAELVVQGRLRKDFYYRINIVTIELPPLRERLEDVPDLLEHFVQKFSRTTGRPAIHFEPAVINQLCQYPFPGNIRELENLVERLHSLFPGERITLKDLPAEYTNRHTGNEMVQWISTELTLREAQQIFEERFVRLVLDEEGGNRSKTAERLGVSRKNLWERLSRYSENKTLP